MMLKLAWRNIWRKRGRTAIVITAISLSMAMLFVSYGLNDDTHARMLKAASKSAGGDLIIHGNGYWETRTNEILLKGADAKETRFKKLPNVKAIIPRVMINGLLRSARGAALIEIKGIVPEKEAHLQDFSIHLQSGSFLETEKPSGGQHRLDSIVIGAALADDLKVELGKPLSLTFTDLEGETSSHLFTLRGLLSTGSKMTDRQLAFITLDAAQRALRAEDQVTQLGVLLLEPEEREVTRQALKKHLNNQDAEILTWEEAMPEMVGYVEFEDAFGYLYGAVMFLIVAFGIANTFLVSVMERTRELGLLNALGLAPKKIAQLILYEGIILGIISLTFGFLLGYLLHLYFLNIGLDITEVYDMEEMEVSGIALTDTIIRSEIRPLKWLLSSLSIFVLVIVSALYPAWRATRLNPVDAMNSH